LKVELLPSGEKQNVEITDCGKGSGCSRAHPAQGDGGAGQGNPGEGEKRIPDHEKALATPPRRPLWSGPFTRPLEGEVVGPFGRRSIINEMPRSPHSGVDLRAAKGTPVRSIHDGKVLLIAEHFFSGKSVVIDHGGAIQSMYFHLEKSGWGRMRRWQEARSSAWRDRNRACHRTPSSFRHAGQRRAGRSHAGYRSQRKNGAAMTEKKFEEAMERLENIVESLEKGDLSLEESLKIFRRGDEAREFLFQETG
jgi:exodeoxyribonuclease VII small subunit